MSIVEDIIITEYQYRTTEDSGSKYVVYKICLNNNQQTWYTFRRFNDFVRFDPIAKSLKKDFTCSLPPRNTISNLLHFKASRDEKEFINDRIVQLNDYLIDLVKHTNPNDYSFWNHPSVMTFFDIPIIHCQGEDHKAEWMMEFEKLQEILEEFSHNYNSNIDENIGKRNRTKRTIKKMIRDLGSNSESLNREQLESLQSIRDKFQILIGGAISNHSTEDSDKNDLLSRTSRPSWNLYPLSSSLNNPLSPLASGEDVLKKQQNFIDQQDNYLSEISAAVHRQKLIAQEMLKESEEQHQILDSTQQSMSNTQNRLHGATDRAKKLP